MRAPRDVKPCDVSGFLKILTPDSSEVLISSRWEAFSLEVSPEISKKRCPISLKGIVSKWKIWLMPLLRFDAPVKKRSTNQ
jgi:hypothetical protein